MRALRFSALLTLLFTTAAWGQKSPPYFAIDPPEKYSDTHKVEVVEVFSYGCVHCAHFQSKVDAWRKTLDTNRVEFVYLPSPYNAADTALARGYFAAKALGVAEKTHNAMFSAIHERGYRVQSFNDVVALYGQLGVSTEEFGKAGRDFFVDAQLRRALEFMFKYKIDGTPTLIVAGKYRVTAESAGNPDAMIKVANQLIAQELAASSQSTSTSRQAPKRGK